MLQNHVFHKQQQQQQAEMIYGSYSAMVTMLLRAEPPAGMFLSLISKQCLALFCDPKPPSATIKFFR